MGASNASLHPLGSRVHHGRAPRARDDAPGGPCSAVSFDDQSAGERGGFLAYKPDVMNMASNQFNTQTRRHEASKVVTSPP